MGKRWGRWLAGGFGVLVVLGLTALLVERAVMAEKLRELSSVNAECRSELSELERKVAAIARGLPPPQLGDFPDHRDLVPTAPGSTIHE